MTLKAQVATLSLFPQNKAVGKVYISSSLLLLAVNQPLKCTSTRTPKWRSKSQFTGTWTVPAIWWSSWYMHFQYCVKNSMHALVILPLQFSNNNLQYCICVHIHAYTGHLFWVGWLLRQVTEPIPNSSPENIWDKICHYIPALHFNITFNHCKPLKCENQNRKYVIATLLEKRLFNPSLTGAISRRQIGIGWWHL